MATQSIPRITLNNGATIPQIGFGTLKHELRQMRKPGSGVIVNRSSRSGLAGAPDGGFCARWAGARKEDHHD